MSRRTHDADCGRRFTALCYRFAVGADEPGLAQLVDRLFAGLLPGADVVDHSYSLRSSPEIAGAIDVWCDDDLVTRGQRPGDALGWLVWHVNRGVATASGRHLLLHAGALETPRGAALVIGASGSGKSTLVAGLARTGLGYLGDELIALDLNTSSVLPYQKPITLKAGSFAVLPDLHPDLAAGPRSQPWDGEQWQVPVGGDGGLLLGRACAPGIVLVPRYDATAPTRLIPLTQTETFLMLALHAVNLRDHGATGTQALAAVSRRSPGFSLSLSDLDEACRQVSDLLDAGVSTAPTSGSQGDVARVR